MTPTRRPKRTGVASGLVTTLALGTGAASFAAESEPAETPLPGAHALAQDANAAYDGRFAFVRLRYDDRRPLGGRLFPYGWGRWPFWAHDMPHAEHNFLCIVEELTTVVTAPDSRLVLDADDPELFRYPVAHSGSGLLASL